MNKMLIKKKYLLLIGGFLIGIVLLVYGSGFTDNKNNEDHRSEESNETYYSEMLESRLEEFLKTVDGIDHVRVFVTVDGGNEYEYAQKGGSEGYAADYLIIHKDNDEEAAVVREIYPKIRGVGVSCSGGEDPSVKEEIISLLGAALGISSNKIMVTRYGN